MIQTIEYPQNSIQLYAKGTSDDGRYFEVPAIFNENGTCDVEATLVKVQEGLTLSLRVQRPNIEE
jgi:hypothetical protein